MITRGVGRCLDSFLTASTSKVGSRAGCERKAAVPAAGTTGPDTLTEDLEKGSTLPDNVFTCNPLSTVNSFTYVCSHVDICCNLRITCKSGPPSAASKRLKRSRVAIRALLPRRYRFHSPRRQ